ncbi:MAG: hypothetical protein K6T86_03090, partial [Pirellulales bacterium]|nr:hypothetical protein [Pirellulales bacterium]
KNNREWTVCQVRHATDALVRGLQLDPQQRQRLYHRVAQRIAYCQRCGALARHYHRQRTSTRPEPVSHSHRRPPPLREGSELAL